MVKGCVSRGFSHATSAHVYLHSRVHGLDILVGKAACISVTRTTTDLETALHGEYSGEDVIGGLEDFVLVLGNGILEGEGDRAQHDHEHDEHVKHLLRHDPVNPATHPVV